MSKTLIITEKPSVATDLARVLGKSLGKFKRDEKSGAYANEDYYITSAVGHLLEQKKPQTEAGKSLPWKMDYLPIIPKTMELEPIPKTADRLRKVLKLAKSKEVTTIVNACDAGREGELIFRNIIRYGKISKKTLKRLWMQSMTDEAINEAWSRLLSDETMLPLADAAECRSASDWLVGLNSTRALTVLQSAPGGFHVTPTGRVQTPTLALLALRQQDILAFVPEAYSEVRAQFGVSAGSYEGRWYDAAWKKDEQQPLRSKERIWDREQAQAIIARCEGKQGEVIETKKPVKQAPPLLFDLTSLQKEASNRFGFSARRTLQLAQECYERHKVLTYPRTDSKFLPDDYVKTAYRTVGDIQRKVEDFSDIAGHILDKKLIKGSKRIFDSSKVSDHFAIIPTGHFTPLSGDVEKIYTLVLQRFLGVFLPPAEYEDTDRKTIITHADGQKDHFSSHGRILLHEGWKVLYTKSARQKKEELCPVAPNERAQTLELELRDEMTKPPANYNEATLLSAMEGAGKLVEDEELSSAMKERGLGTPATRASIIEGLITQEYVVRDGKELIATRRGMDLIDLLGRIGLSTLSSPELTGDWEYRLKQMEQGKLSRTTFMKDIASYTEDIISSVRNFMDSGHNPDLPIACPACATVGLTSRMDSVSCKQCKFRLRRLHAGLALTDELLTDLIIKRELPIMEGFRSRFGKPFKAGLRLEEGPRSWKAEFYFEDEKSPAQAAAEGEQESLGMLPIKGQGEMEVMENSKAWTVAEFQREGTKRQGLSLSRMILGKQLERPTMEKIFAEGKSELITGFVSQRTKRPFDAFLVLDAKKGQVGFEFPPREPRKKGEKADSRFTKANAAAADLSQATKHGMIAVKGKGEHELLESDKAWHVPSLIYGKAKKPLAIAREMCGVAITAPIVQRLLTKGKTELIKDFVSAKSGKKFEAYLSFKPTTGKVSYEFPEREA